MASIKQQVISTLRKSGRSDLADYASQYLSRRTATAAALATDNLLRALQSYKWGPSWKPRYVPQKDGTIIMEPGGDWPDFHWGVFDDDGLYLWLDIDILSVGEFDATLRSDSVKDITRAIKEIMGDAGSKLGSGM